MYTLHILVSKEQGFQVKWTEYNRGGSEGVCELVNMFFWGSVRVRVKLFGC